MSGPRVEIADRGGGWYVASFAGLRLTQLRYAEATGRWIYFDERGNWAQVSTDAGLETVLANMVHDLFDLTA
jgi:hypothetical protein